MKLIQTLKNDLVTVVLTTLVLVLIFSILTYLYGFWTILGVIGIYIVYKGLGETSSIRGGDHGGSSLDE